MNFKITGIIIRREYLNRVKKKSFLIITFLAPILFAALCILPSLILMGTEEEAKKIAVVDNSGIALSHLSDNKGASYSDCSSIPLDSLKQNLEQLGYDAVLSVSAIDTAANTVSAELFSGKPLGIDLTENINNRLNDAVEAYRIDGYQIDGLDSILESIKANVKLRSYTMDDEGKETVSESGVYMLVSMILGMILYMFIALFSGMVMSGVIEEKSSRVVEVLVSSVKATELMFGKIIGIALVALTQFFLWIVLTIGIVGVAGGIMGKSLLESSDTDPMELVQGMSGMDADQLQTLTEAVADQSETSVIFTTLKNLPLGQIFISFILFFVFGYMLYASVFAAIGSAVENEGDSQQLQLPVTVPLLLAFFVALYAFKAPGSSLVFWFSMIPFTSPIVMLARIPFGVPTWQLVLSIAILVVTFWLIAKASARIYKVGILMFGKKSSWKDLWKWMKQK